jgi:predicted Zn-dependent protease
MGLVTFFETIGRQSRGGGGFLSSHPATGERIRNTRDLIRQLEADTSLRTTDRGKLEIIQRRIRLLTGVVEAPLPPTPQRPDPAPSQQPDLPAPQRPELPPPSEPQPEPL